MLSFSFCFSQPSLKTEKLFYGFLTMCHRVLKETKAAVLPKFACSFVLQILYFVLEVNGIAFHHHFSSQIM